MCHYSCAASTTVTPEKPFISTSLHHALAGSAPRLSTRRTSVLPRLRNSHFLIVKRKVHSFKTVAFDPSPGCADFNLAGLLCLVPQVQ